jgi:hypothetical protein
VATVVMAVVQCGTVQCGMLKLLSYLCAVVEQHRIQTRTGLCQAVSDPNQCSMALLGVRYPEANMRQGRLGLPFEEDPVLSSVQHRLRQSVSARILPRATPSATHGRERCAYFKVAMRSADACSADRQFCSRKLGGQRWGHGGLACAADLRYYLGGLIGKARSTPVLSADMRNNESLDEHPEPLDLIAKSASTRSAPIRHKVHER